MYCDCQNTADLFIYLYSWWLIFLDCGVFLPICVDIILRVRRFSGLVRNTTLFKFGFQGYKFVEEGYPRKP